MDQTNKSLKFNESSGTGLHENPRSDMQTQYPDKGPGGEDATAAAGGIGKRHMVIKYNEVDKKYYLRDLGDGSGTFVRVDNSRDLILKHGFIISFGDSHMVVQFSSEVAD